MAESTIPKPESETAPRHSNSHQADESAIFEIFGNVSDCVGLLLVGLFVRPLMLWRRSLEPGVNYWCQLRNIL
jgi:hypothetical protein